MLHASPGRVVEPRALSRRSGAILPICITSSRRGQLAATLVLGAQAAWMELGSSPGLKHRPMRITGLAFSEPRCSECMRTGSIRSASMTASVNALADEGRSVMILCWPPASGNSQAGRRDPPDLAASTARTLTSRSARICRRQCAPTTFPQPLPVAVPASRVDVGEGVACWAATAISQT
jgi:hypothetical protein